MIPRIQKALALAAVFTQVPHTTSLMDVLDEAEQAAEGKGREYHRRWREAYEKARAEGAAVLGAIAFADSIPPGEKVVASHG